MTGVVSMTSMHLSRRTGVLGAYLMVVDAPTLKSVAIEDECPFGSSDDLDWYSCMSRLPPKRGSGVKTVRSGAFNPSYIHHTVLAIVSASWTHSPQVVHLATNARDAGKTRSFPL